MTMVDTMYIAVQADKFYIEDPKEFKVIFERNYDKLLTQHRIN